MTFMSAKYGPVVSQSIEIIIPENQYEDYIDVKLLDKEENFKGEVLTSSIYQGDTIEDENHCKYSPDYRLLVKAPRNLEQITVDERCKVIRANAFEGCSKLESAFLPSVVAIGKHAFCACGNLKNIYLSNNLSYIGEYAFIQCSSLLALYLPNLFCFPPISDDSYEKSIYDEDGEHTYTEHRPWNVIIGCNSLKEILLPTKLRKIGEKAFAGLHSLSAIEVGGELNSIEDGAFAGCTKLKRFIITSETPPELGNNVFKYVNDFIIYVPSEKIDLYRKTPGWVDYANRIQSI